MKIVDVADGTTVAEALTMAEEAIRFLIEHCRTQGFPISPDGPLAFRYGDNHGYLMSGRSPAENVTCTIRTQERVGSVVVRSTDGQRLTVHF